MAETFCSDDGTVSNKPNKVQINLLVYVFLINYFKWQQSLTEDSDQEKEVTKKLMEDSDLYI